VPREPPTASSPAPAPAPNQTASFAHSRELVVLDHEPGAFLFGHWKNIAILAWAAQANASTIARLKHALSRVVSHPGGRSTISVIAEGLPLPTQEARAGLVDLVNQGAGLACLAVVVNGTGFGSSALISAHTEMRNKSKRTYEMGVLGSVEELKVWLPPLHLRRTNVRIEPEQIGDNVHRAFDIIRVSER
jgi:hypothetical protein